MGLRILVAPNHVGFRASREPYMVHGGRRAQKKSPASALKTGDLPADTLHSLILEDLLVKNIQAGFLTLGSF